MRHPYDYKALILKKSNMLSKKLRIKKLPGHDLISNIMAKNLHNKTIIFLPHIFNTLLSGYHTFQALGNTWLIKLS